MILEILFYKPNIEMNHYQLIDKTYINFENKKKQNQNWSYNFFLQNLQKNNKMKQLKTK